MSNKELKPFCVKSDDVTEEDLNRILKRCIELGAYQLEWVDGFGNSEYHDNTSYYVKEGFLYWGVDVDLNTLAANDYYYYDDNILTKEKAFEMLGILPEEKDKEEEKEDTLVGLLKEANCSLVINFPYITVIDKEANTHYNLPHEDEIVTFVNKLIDIKKFLREEGGL